MYIAVPPGTTVSVHTVYLYTRAPVYSYPVYGRCAVYSYPVYGRCAAAIIIPSIYNGTVHLSKTKYFFFELKLFELEVLPIERARSQLFNECRVGFWG